MERYLKKHVGPPEILAHDLLARARTKALCICTHKSSSRTRSSAIVSWSRRLSWCHLSSRLKESGTGNCCNGDACSMPSNLVRPSSPANSSGSRWRTTDFAAPCSLLHTRAAAWQRSGLQWPFIPLAGLNEPFKVNRVARPCGYGVVEVLPTHCYLLHFLFCASCVSSCKVRSPSLDRPGRGSATMQLVAQPIWSKLHFSICVHRQKVLSKACEPSHSKDCFLARAHNCPSLVWEVMIAQVTSRRIHMSNWFTCVQRKLDLLSY